MELLIVGPNDTVPAYVQGAEVRPPDGVLKVTTQAGSNPTDIAPLIRPWFKTLVRCLVHGFHDVGDTAGSPEFPDGGDLVGVISLHNGWDCRAPNARDAGHGYYSQNYGSRVQKLIDTCIFGPNFATAWKIYTERPNTEINKISGYTVRNTISVGWTVFGGLSGAQGATSQGIEDVVFENKVFIGDVDLGYSGRGRNVTMRNCIIFGALRTGDKGFDGLTLENNDIIVFPPYRRDGWTYGDGNTGFVCRAGEFLPAGATPTMERSISGLVCSGNRIFTGAPGSAFNGYSHAQLKVSVQKPISDGFTVVDTRTAPAYPLTVKRFPVPGAAGCEHVFVYNPAGLERIPLGGWYRIRNVRDWHHPYSGQELVMSGEPALPVGWREQDGPLPPQLASMLPTFGVFHIEALSQEEIIVALSTELQATIDQLTTLKGQAVALEQQNATLTQQVATLTARVTELEQQDDAFEAAAVEAAGHIQAAGEALAPFLPDDEPAPGA